jgi:hypothetical protein
MKQKKKTPIIIPTLVAGVALLGGALTSQAQLLYLQDFETDQNAAGTWVTNALGNSPADLYFDYSTIGIPSAPNSTGGTTRGAKLNANLGTTGVANTGVFPGGVSVSPLDFSLPYNTNFVIHCDVWWNFNGPAPAGGSGSTQMGGLGYGTAGATPQVVGGSDSFFAVASGEGGSGDDYRIYTRAFPGSVQLASGAYLAGTVAGSRNNTAALYATNFPGQTAPAAQVALYPQQTGTTANGTQGWKWRDVKIEKIGPFVTWSIDGVILTRIDMTTNGLAGGGELGGDRLLLTLSDINAGNSTDTNAAALAFMLYDNLRVSNIVANIVNVTAPAPQASEAGPSPATITFERSISTGPLTINYTIGGTAANGVDYTNELGGALSGTITFLPGESTTNLVIVPIDDNLSEPAETILITVSSGPGYVATGSAVATIADNDQPLLIASVVAGSMYERHPTDFASVRITRWGDTSLPLQLEVGNFSFGGTAVLNTDYVVNSSLFPLTIDSGISAITNNLVSPLDNAAYTGNKTIIVGLAAGAGFSVTASNATLTIIDDENPAATVLYTNALTSAADASNWNLTYANGDMLTFGGTDYEASFGYDLSANLSGGGVVAPPPGGANNALRVTVNKIVANNAGVNLYPTNVSFQGNYAVRFNMNVILDTAGATTHGPLFGINHTGFQTNWWAGSGVVAGNGPWAMDGLFYWVSPDGGAAVGDYVLRTGAGGALPNGGFTTVATANLDSFTGVFKGPPAPYSGIAGPGLIGNDPPAFGGDTSTWTDVEVKQLGNIVTMSLNKIRVLTYTNTTTFTNGTVMLGYSDPFSSIGEAAGAAYFANLSVVAINPPTITSIVRSGSDVTIQFTSNDGTVTPASFDLQAAGVVTGPYTNVTTATITQLPSLIYQATTTSTASAQYYRIRQR